MIIFNPVRGANLQVIAAATSAVTPITIACRALRVLNTGANIAYVRLGAGSFTASVADTPILPSDSLILPKLTTDTGLACISANGTNLEVQPGAILDHAWARTYA